MVLTQLSIIIHKWKYCPFSSFWKRWKSTDEWENKRKI